MRHTPSDVTGQPAPRWRPTRRDRRRADNRRRPAASRPAASAILSLANRLAR